MYPGKRDTTRNISYGISFSSKFFMLYRGILDYFLDSVYAREVDSETAGRLADGLYKIN